ncbi:MAG TPA: hypothetical protein VNN55_06655 [bacterium]|nr:hypothetical protein [bacterium]
MNCRGVENWVWKEGAGNLPAAVVEHAAACPGCRALIEEVRLLDRSVAAMPVPEPGEDYWNYMREQVARRLDAPVTTVISLEPATPRWQRILTRVWAPALAVVLVAVVANQRALVTTESVHILSEAELQSRVKALAQAPNSSEFANLEETAPATEPSATALAPVRRQTESALRTAPAPYAAGATTAAEPELATGPVDVPASSSAEPTMAIADRRGTTPSETLWPDRQVMIMGQVDSNAPDQKSSSDDGRLAAQDPFGAYERQMALADQGFETAGAASTPTRLLEGPAAAPSRGSERLTTAEQMRRFDEIAELRELIARLETVPPSSRAMSQWSQWSTAWYRLGMLSDQQVVVDSAIVAVDYFTRTVPGDSATAREWQNRRTHLENRRTALQR